MPRGKPGIHLRVNDSQWKIGVAVLPKACSEVGKARLRAAAKRGFDSSQERVHVDTGALKASGRIVERDDGLNLEIEVVYGEDLDYAAYEESYHPFLQPAMLQALSGFRSTPGARSSRRTGCRLDRR